MTARLPNHIVATAGEEIHQQVGVEANAVLSRVVDGFEDVVAVGTDQVAAVAVGDLDLTGAEGDVLSAVDSVDVVEIAQATVVAGRLSGHGGGYQGIGWCHDAFLNQGLEGCIARGIESVGWRAHWTNPRLTRPWRASSARSFDPGRPRRHQPRHRRFQRRRLNRQY